MPRRLTVVLQCYPLDNSDVTTDQQWSAMARQYATDGVEGLPSDTQLKVTAGSGLNVNIALGNGILRGFYVGSTTAETRASATNTTSSPRIDRLVFRVNLETNTKDFVIIAGTPATTPVAPNITYTATIFDLPLADLRVEAADTISSITDRRQRTNPYGIIPCTSNGRPNTRGIPGIAYETDTKRVISTSGDGVWNLGLGDAISRPLYEYSPTLGYVTNVGNTDTLIGINGGVVPAMNITFTTSLSGLTEISFGAYIIRDGTDAHVSCKITGSGGTVVIDDDEFTIHATGEGTDRVGGSMSITRVFVLPASGEFVAELHYRASTDGVAPARGRIDDRWLKVQRYS